MAARGAAFGHVRKLPSGRYQARSAAAGPRMDVSGTRFAPLLRRTPPGETIIVNAANSRLARLYREQGFSQAGLKPLSLSPTMPTIDVGHRTVRIVQRRRDDCRPLWDLTGYPFLRVLDGSLPTSLLDLDVFFLVTVPWVGPVETAVVASGVVVVISSWVYLAGPGLARPPGPPRRDSCDVEHVGRPGTVWILGQFGCDQ